MSSLFVSLDVFWTAPMGKGETANGVKRTENEENKGHKCRKDRKANAPPPPVPRIGSQRGVVVSAVGREQQTKKQKQSQTQTH